MESPWVEQARKRSEQQDRTNILALSSGPLVYVRTLKCASSFFTKNFKQWGWHEIHLHEIDWVNQHVFGHMLDPYERRHKGIAEFISMKSAQDEFYKNETFRNFIATVPVLDPHSSSYHDQYGGYVNAIDWIPISGYKSTTVAETTEKLLWQHGIKIYNRWNWDHARPAGPGLAALQKDVKDLYELAPYSESMHWYLQRDQQLYNRVCNKFDHTAAAWPDISWLREATTV